MRQITANIEERLRDTRLREASLIEWQTKVLAKFIAATVPTEGKKNPLADAADKIRLRMETEDGISESDAPPEVFVERGSQVAENKAGSYESLLSGFGGSRQ